MVDIVLVVCWFSSSLTNNYFTKTISDIFTNIIISGLCIFKGLWVYRNVYILLSVMVLFMLWAVLLFYWLKLQNSKIKENRHLQHLLLCLQIKRTIFHFGLEQLIILQHKINSLTRSCWRDSIITIYRLVYLRVWTWLNNNHITSSSV